MSPCSYAEVDLEYLSDARIYRLMTRLKQGGDKFGMLWLDRYLAPPRISPLVELETSVIEDGHLFAYRVSSALDNISMYVSNGDVKDEIRDKEKWLILFAIWAEFSDFFYVRSYGLKEREDLYELCFSAPWSKTKTLELKIGMEEALVDRTRVMSVAHAISNGEARESRLVALEQKHADDIALYTEDLEEGLRRIDCHEDIFYETLD